MKKKYFFDFKKSVWNIFNVIKSLETLDFDWNIDKFRTEKILENIKTKKFKNNLIFVFTDNIEIIPDKLLKIISFENELVFINIFDYFENDLEKLDKNIAFRNWTDFINISLSDAKKLEKYKTLRNQKITNFQNLLKRNNIKNLSLDTKKDSFKELFLFFSK